MESYLTTNELAEKWGYTPAMVTWLIRQKRLRGVVKDGRKYMIPVSAEILPAKNKVGRPRNGEQV